MRSASRFKADDDTSRHHVVTGPHVLDRLPMPAFGTDPAGALTYVNDACVHLWGARPEFGSTEWQGVWRLFRADGTSLGFGETTMGLAASTGETTGQEELTAELQDGRRIRILPRTAPIVGDDGRAAGATTVLVDVTDQRRTEDALRKAESERVFSRLADGADVSMADIVSWAPAVLYVYDLYKNKSLFQNRPLGELLGYSAAETSAMKGSEWRLLMHPEDQERWPSYRDGLEGLPGGAVSLFEYRMRQKDGAWRWLLSRDVRMPDSATGRSPYVVGTTTDITDRKRDEAVLRRNAETFLTLVERSPFGIYTVDSSFKVRNLSHGSLGAFKNVDPIIGRDFEEVMRTIWPELVASEIVGIFRHTLETGEPYVSPGLTEQRADTTVLESYEWQTHRVALDDGEPGVVCYFFDTTRLQDAQRALVDHARSLELLNSVGAALSASLDSENILQSVTDAATELTGAEFGAFFFNAVDERGESYLLYTLSGVPRKAFEAFELPRNTALFGPTFRGETVVRCDDVREDPRFGLSAPHFGMPEGHLPVRSYLAVPVVSRSGEVFGGLFFGHSSVGVFTEMSERSVSSLASQAAIALDNARLYESVRRSEERFRALTDATSDAVYRMSPDWSAMWRMEGRNFVAATSEPSRSWLDEHVPAEERAKVKAAIGRAIAEVGKFECEYQVVRDDGTVGWTSSRAVPLLDQDGNTVEWFGAATDVTDRKQAEEALLEAKRQLEEADKRKDEFLATLAHELRNPLAPIQSAVDILGRSGLGSELKWSHEVIDRQVKHLARLIDDLIDVSRITRDKLELRTTRLGIIAVVTAAVEATRSAFEHRGQSLTIGLPDEDIALEGDLVRLSQVFVNLLNNATKYTAPAGHVSLTVQREDSEVVVTVADDGQGISAECLPQVFQMFYQVKDDRDQGAGGLGIGLSLVKRLVELHGGNVTAFSDGPGQGSRFVVRLPCLVHGPEDGREDGTGSDDAQSESVRRILIVDDNKDAADTLARLLRILGHDVRAAYGGSDGLRIAEEWRPDVALLDVGMPDLDGLEVCRRIRTQAWGSEATLIALTGWGQVEDRLKTEAAGFDHHLTKPVDTAELLSRLGHRTSGLPSPLA